MINDKEIKYKIRVTDSRRFMQGALSNLEDNLSELKINKIDNDVLIKDFITRITYVILMLMNLIHY